MKEIYNELLHYNIHESNIEIISNKDGIIVSKVSADKENYVLKYFEKEEYRREIDYYNLFESLKIKTIKVHGTTEKSILLEDIESSKNYKLANPCDLELDQVIISLANYYRALHLKGRDYLENHSDVTFYSEISLINKANIEKLIIKTKYDNIDYWRLINKLIIDLQPFYQVNRTITYNDFYYGNVIVSKNQDESFMFDYNLLGEGLRYFDISNVLSGLCPEMRGVFLKAYGDVDEYELKLNEHLAPLIGLISAYEKNTFPSWAVDELEALKTGKLYKSLNEWMKS